MAVRIKDWVIPYTWGIGIEITNNHIINVLLRAMNNLIHYTGEDDPEYDGPKELYVDLQLPAGIQPEDDFPVGVNVGEILQEDWWQQSGTILNWKTTSWDYVRLIYANDGKLYYDPWTWTWIELINGGSIWPIIANINTKTFWIDDNQDLENWQSAYDWLNDDKMPLISYDDSLFLLTKITENQWSTAIEFRDLDVSLVDGDSTSTSKGRKITLTVVSDEVTAITIGEYQISPNVLATDVNYNVPYTPLYNGSPATKKYVDDGLATKQNVLTPWTRITIQDNVISADISGVFIYKWNVTDSSQLPSSWQTVGDCWYDESDHTLWAWDWTQWKDIGGTGIDLSNYFNMTVNNSDDITEWNTNLFVTNVEKNYWNNKQATLIEWDNIHIDGNVISADDTTYTWGTAIEIDNNNAINNTKPFDPENEWVLSQWLKRTSTWYRWSNLNEFNPNNAGSTGQVIKKTQNGYEWSDETAGTYLAGHWIEINDRTIVNTLPFDPWTWTTWQVLKKTSSWYHWADESGGWGWGWDANIKLFTINSESDVTIDQSVIREAISWYNQWKLPILRWYKTWGELNSKGWRFFTPSEFGKIQRSGQINDYLTFTAPYNDTDYTIDTVEWVTRMAIPQVKVEYNWNTIISAWLGWASALWSDFLSTTHDYSTPYIPRYNGSPATKKYVDDNVSVVSGDNNTKYTVKVSSSAPAAWTPNTTITFKTS